MCNALQPFARATRLLKNSEVVHLSTDREKLKESSHSPRLASSKGSSVEQCRCGVSEVHMGFGIARSMTMGFIKRRSSHQRSF